MTRSADVMFLIALIVAGVTAGSAAVAIDAPPGPISWPADISERIQFVHAQPDGTLRVDAPGPADLNLMEVDQPGISQPFFGMRMQIQNQQVAPAGFVQMDVAFGPGEVYFSRQPLDGDGPWRALDLPFNASQPGGSWRNPIALQLRLILPGGGNVSLGPVEIIEAGSWAELSRASGAWWSEVEAGWIGAIGGVFFGSVGAIVGILVGRGRARGMAMTVCWLAGVLGAGALVAGLVALARGQESAVFYPLLVLGALGATLFPWIALRSRSVYASGELRRMRARDA